MIAAAGRAAVHEHFARRQRLQTEQYADQAGLAGAVGAEDGEELATTYVEIQAVPQDAITEAQRRVAQRDSDLGVSHRGLAAAHCPGAAARPGTSCAPASSR